LIVCLLHAPNGEVRVELDAAEALERKPLLLSGPELAVAQVRQWLSESYGLDGVRIRERCRPADLARCLSSPTAEAFSPRVVEGAELLVRSVQKPLRSALN
jgi:hypothetical protein